MLVGERMSRNPVTILDTASIDDGMHLMRERKVRRLPVLDASGKMVGIVSDKDLLHAAPSPATSLSVYELHYLLAKLTIKQVMSSPVISVGADTPVEEAARVMADNKIGGLPVMDGDKLVGIITETDVFKILVELLGARTPGLRITIAVTEGKGVLARLTQALARARREHHQRRDLFRQGRVPTADHDQAERCRSRCGAQRAREDERPGRRLPRGIRPWLPRSLRSDVLDVQSRRPQVAHTAVEPNTWGSDYARLS